MKSLWVIANFCTRGSKSSYLILSFTHQEIDFGIIKILGVVNEAGTSIHFMSGFSGEMEIMTWLDEDELQMIKETRDPYDTPACPNYEPQPEKLGKIIWISGW